MKTADQKLWPYKPKLSIIIAIILVITLLVITGILRSTTGWPSDATSNTVLIGILILSVLPVLLAILDMIMERGGTIGYKDFKIDFSKMKQSGLSGFTIPANIGVPGVAVSDSGTDNILAILRQATSSSIVVVDLEDGHAWWETRLLVLVSGAARLGNPGKIVFVANEEGRERIFQGWAKPRVLLQQLLKENGQYQRSYHSAMAATKQWEHMPPLEKIPPIDYYQVPPIPMWIYGNLAVHHAWMTFSTKTGLPNELLTEQLLQHELGEKIEKQPDGSRHINIMRLNEIFKPVLLNQTIDSQWTEEQQTAAIFTGDATSIAITQDRKYIELVTRQSLFNEALKNIFNNQSK